MATRVFEKVGRNTNDLLATFGDFSIFSGKALRWLFTGWFRWKSFRLLLPQLYEVGVKSVPVVSVVGAFIGMVMAVETYSEFKAFGQESRMGS
jgi:phospholipid/cholesterol/gamma-HCH transport system permease protein